MIYMAKAKKKIEKKEEAIEEVEEVEEEVVLEDKAEEEAEYEPLSVEDRLLNIEKKLSTILILVIITLAIAAITMIVAFGGNDGNSTYSDKGSNSGNSSSEQADDYTYDTSKFKEISAQDIAAESKGKTIVVMIGRQGCGYCSIYAPIIEKVAEAQNVQVRYIDFLKIVDISAGTVTDSDAYNLIKNLDAVSDWDKFGETALKGTPNTLFIKNSKIIYGVNGYHEEADVEAAFKAAGL
jgi:thioredoxin-related protein